MSAMKEYAAPSAAPPHVAAQTLRRAAIIVLLLGVVIAGRTIGAIGDAHLSRNAAVPASSAAMVAR